MANGKYILDDEGNVVEVDDLLEWAEWIEKAGDKKRIAYDEVGEYFVSTVFLGLDYSFGVGDVPILFETMVFEKKATTEDVLGKQMTFHKDVDIGGSFNRYATRAEAEQGHKDTVAKLKMHYENESSR